MSNKPFVGGFRGGHTSARAAATDYDESENNPNHIEPKPAAEITVVDRARVRQRDEARDMLEGYGTDATQLRSLQQDIDSLEHKEAALQADGRSLSRAEKSELDSKRKTLQWQSQVYAETMEVTGGLERRDAIAADQSNMLLYDQLESVYEREKTSAVLKIMEEKKRAGLLVTAAEASDILDTKMAAMGVDKYLPRSAAFAARNEIALAGHAAPQPPARTQTPPVTDNVSFATSAAAEFKATKARVDSALASGQQPDMADMIKLDKLAAFLN